MTVRIKLNKKSVDNLDLEEFFDYQGAATIEGVSVHKELDEVHFHLRFMMFGENLALVEVEMEADFWEWYNEQIN